MRTLAVMLVGVLLLVDVASAQSVQLQSNVQDSAAILLAELLDRGDFVLADRDTLIGPDEVVSGDLLVVGARLTLEGRIEGGVAVVEGEFFVRPRATIVGPIAVLGRGGAYMSGLADAGRPVYAHPRNDVRVTRSGDVLTIRVLPPPPPPAVRLPNIIGLDLPTYDRVNGLSLAWGPEIRFGGGDTAVVTIRPTVGLRATRGRVDGAIDLLLRPSRHAVISARAARTTRTPDAWIRGPLANSLSSLLVQSDTRDYFESDELSLTVGRAPPPPLIQGDRFFTPSLTLRASRDRSLQARDPWTLLSESDGWRENPSIDDGEILSIIAAARAGWEGASSSFRASLATEWSPDGLGDHEFAQLSLSARFDMQALWNHSISVSTYFLHPLGGLAAPRQRWSHVGGAGTLATFPTAFMRGDHVAYVESAYLAPVDPIRLPLLGVPALRLEHMAGAAWLTGEPFPRFEQNVGAGIQALIFSIVGYVDPAASDLEIGFRLGVHLPGFGGPAGPPFF